MTINLGLLLPHFGEHADPNAILEGAQRAEAAGFDSLWVRDHLIFEPHSEFEEPDRTFYEALTVLAAVGASTMRIRLGTGALVPFRHPIHTALALATLDRFFPGRLIIGMGGGNSDREFEQVGLGGIFRPDLVKSQIEIFRRLWTEDAVSFRDDVYSFEEVTIEPKPTRDAIPLWYCGNTPASARRAARFCDGWLPGRINLATLQKRVATLEEIADEEGRERPHVGIIPTTSVEATRAEALEGVNIEGLLTSANKARFWVKPASGTFETEADLEGMLVAGSPDEVVAQVIDLHHRGVDHLVFDLRLKYERWFHQLELLGQHVVPEVKQRLS